MRQRGYIYTVHQETIDETACKLSTVTSGDRPPPSNDFSDFEGGEGTSGGACVFWGRGGLFVCVVLFVECVLMEKSGHQIRN